MSLIVDSFDGESFAKQTVAKPFAEVFPDQPCLGEVRTVEVLSAGARGMRLLQINQKSNKSSVVCYTTNGPGTKFVFTYGPLLEGDEVDLSEFTAAAITVSSSNGSKPSLVLKLSDASGQSASSVQVAVSGVGVQKIPLTQFVGKIDLEQVSIIELSVVNGSGLCSTRFTEFAFI